MQGKKTLLLDLDPQGQAGKALGIDVKNEPVTMMEVLTDADIPASKAIIPTRIDNLDIICSNKSLTEIHTLSF